MDPRPKKRTKHRQDVAGPSSFKRGLSGKATVSRGPPPRPSYHPSHSSDDEQDERELYERHAPEERDDHYAIRYSKKTKQGTINTGREALVYEGSKQSADLHFLSLFHSDWYRSIYLNKKTPVVPTKEVNWKWMSAKKNSIFDKIKATCDELEMTKMMSFKYDWNEEIICQFYATFYFDADGQKMKWMIAGQQYECTVRRFARMLGLEHQLTMEPESPIHTYNVLKLHEMQFMYAPGAKGHPPKIQNFLPELLTLHRSSMLP
jgi:hypothetical protein